MPFSDSFRALRRNLKARLPYVRRREYAILQRKYSELIEGLGWTAPPATQARLHTIKPVAQPLGGEVCLFVTFAPSARLKRHVQIHVEHLLRVGVQVVLILNTDLAPADFALDPELSRQLSGVVVRENVGFDFAAWAHVYSLCGPTDQWTRLFLVNDSIVGPLDAQAFDRLIERIRASPAGVVGLTESQSPLRHVQSFFLVLNATALRSQAVQRIFQRMLSLPTKSQVIDVYETRLTQVLTQHGLRCEALFPPLSDDPHSANDTAFRWARLIRAGFPYIKASILDKVAGSAQTRALVPAEFLQPDV
jgi:lipopolysaccharide biosynthesis protein